MSNSRLEILFKLLDKSPNDCFLKYAIAIEYQAKEEYDNALKIYEDLYESEPQFLATYYQYAKLLENTDPKKALKIYEDGVSLAQEQNEHKTLNELRSAMEIFEEDLL